MSDIIICSPVFNDWNSALQLLYQVDRVSAEEGLNMEFFFVDDNSSDRIPGKLPEPLQSVKKVTVLRLKRNLGHQRAIAIGLSQIAENYQCNAVVVMDADGEDSPRDIPRLLDKLISTDFSCAVFAKRRKRTETVFFQVCYRLYKIIHRILTGRAVEVGNFSILPMKHLQSLMVVSDLWNHYAASVHQSKIPVETIPADRSGRISGQSKMNFFALVTHGLSAISVYSEIIGVRLLVTMLILSGVNFFVILLVVGIRFFTDLAIPGWATTTVFSLLILFMQFLVISLIYSLFVLQNRNNLTFIPLRDYKFFVSSINEIKYI